MKPISVHVPEQPYEELKSLAKAQNVPVAALIRTAMLEYLDRHRRAGHSVLEMKPSEGGEELRAWSRDELYEEMIRR